MKAFRKKDLSQTRTEMRRHLGLKDLLFLGTGAMVGTGIFTITGIGAATLAGPALVLSIIISAFCVGLSALFFAEFASRIPASGGAYSYIYAVFGEYPAWMVGWFTILEYMMAVSGVAAGWGGYLKGLLASFGWELPQALSGTFNPATGTYIDLLPVLVVAFVTAVVLLQSQTALRFNSLLVVLKFSALLLFIGLGAFFINVENWSPFAPFGFGSLYGAETGIMAGASLMFFSFLGYESLSMAVDEVKEPQKNVPRGIGLSLALVTLMYVLVTLVLTGIVPYEQLNVADAVAFALRSAGLEWAAHYVSLVAILTLITVCLSLTYALSRMIYAIARDGLLPQAFRKLNPVSKVPTNATLLVGVFAAIFAGIFPLASLASFLNIVTLAYLIILAFGLLHLRKTKGMPKENEFKTPLVPLLPLLSILICLSFMVQYDGTTWLAFGVSIIIGSLIYFLYGQKHSEPHEKFR
ncbi:MULTISPECIES: amino acid permease [unclassified Streptococcus]|uniref:amino acid permease n=1 Tax=unclassified Streptococcus TaxID=2608887 RepID=UPI0010727121|nr:MULTISPECIES: amino acid permease [unclassified Streptococcus]MBF0806092.1 amino acid permease [Streptococcus sp. 19428wA2_WM07]TFU28339.1 amino acid permease [Streptococcus sp. WM07]